MTPLLSAIIPARNAGRFLAEALDSVFSQGVEDLEVFVVDDGSTDDTRDVALRYGRGVQVLHQPPSGSGRARNQGLRLASGEFVAFLDADDVWTGEKSRLQLDLLAREPGWGMVFSDMMCVDARAAELADARTYFQQRGFDGRCCLSSIFLYDMVSTPTVMLRRSCLGEAGLFDESLPIGQDTDLWFRVARVFPFGVVNRPLVKRRFHPGNTTRDSRLLARCVVEVWERYLDICVAREPEMKGRLEEDLARKRWHHLFLEGCSLLNEGRPRDARRCLSEAIGVAPLRPRAYAFYLASFLAGRRQEAVR